jgi:hypothetical protein
VTSDIQRAALAYASKGWPVFPCSVGGNWPANEGGYRDATTNPARIEEWFTRFPQLNLAVATGFPGPDVLHIDYRGYDRDGYGALEWLERAGLTAGAGSYVKTPGGGMHLYFAGTRQFGSVQPEDHVSFHAQDSYVLLPPSTLAGKPYVGMNVPGQPGTLDWAAAVKSLDASRLQRQSGAWEPDERRDRFARWVSSQPQPRTALLRTARSTLARDPEADLSALTEGARMAGLSPREVRSIIAAVRDPAPEGLAEPEGYEREGAS